MDHLQEHPGCVKPSRWEPLPAVVPFFHLFFPLKIRELLNTGDCWDVCAGPGAGFHHPHGLEYPSSSGYSMVPCFSGWFSHGILLAGASQGPCGPRCGSWVAHKTLCTYRNWEVPISGGFWASATPSTPQSFCPGSILSLLFPFFPPFLCTHKSNLLENAPKVWAIYQLQEPIKLFFSLFSPIV